MYEMRDRWTDERMDDFAKHLDQRFDSVDHELHRVNDRLDALHRGLFQVGGGIIVALVGIIVTQL